MSRPCSNPGRLVVALLPLVVPFAFSGVADAQASPRAQPAAPLARIDDPLLAPPEPARHQLADWNEALDLIHLWSTDLDIAVQGVERARGSSRQALALALPTLGASGSVSEQLLTATPLPGTASTANPALQAQFTLSQPVLAPREWYGIGTANLAVASAGLNVAEKKRLVLGGVVNGIVSVVIAERVAEINRASLRSALDSLSLTRRQAALGTATRLDVLRFEQDAAATRSTLVSGDEALRQARESLGLALGAGEAWGVSPSISLVEVERSMRETCSPGTLEERPDLRQARNDADIAARGITDVWLAFSPFASLSSTAGAANQASPFSGRDWTWSVQALLTIPLWDGGARYGGLRIARANAAESKLRLESAVRVATIREAQALRSILVAEQLRSVVENLRDLARETAELSRRTWEMGTGTSFDLVDSAQKARAAEVDLAVKEFTVIQAKLGALLALSTCEY